jgi:ligand-binding sensor domain-containing protein
MDCAHREQDLGSPGYRVPSTIDRQAIRSSGSLTAAAAEVFRSPNISISLIFPSSQLRQQRQEFFAAPPGNDVLVAKQRRPPCRDYLQRLVADSLSDSMVRVSAAQR